MVTIERSLTGGFRVKDQNGNELGRIISRLFSSKHIIKDSRGNVWGYTDICVHNPQNPDSSLLENTEYTLFSASNGEQLAVGLPAYNETIDRAEIKAFSIKPLLADKMKIRISSVDEELILILKMSGRAMIFANDKNVCGYIHYIGGHAFSVDIRNLDVPVLLCGIFLFTRYLLKENEPIAII